MKDLKKESGLSIYLKDDFRLDLDIKLMGGEFSSRTIADMEKVIRDKIKINDNPLYFTYRNVRERIDEQKIKNNGLRFDLTVVLPRFVGSEFNKTFGHYHPIKEGTDLTYPEIYEVISGKALFLLQKKGKKEDEIDEAYLVEANAGEKVIIPPNFGHVTINPKAEPLVMSNWVADEFESEYEEYEKYHGAGYYIVKSEKEYKIEKNTNYKKLPKLVMAKPKELPQFAIKFGKPMYISGNQNIKSLKYLVNPEEFGSEILPEKVLDFI